MKEQRTAKGSTSSHVWEHLEEFVREHVQRFIQALLEEAVRELVGRQKSVRRAAVGAPARYRNGHGKPWRLALMSGTIADEREEYLVDQVLINLAELLPANRSFYHYSGSLTTPPCSEGAKWYIMKHLIKVSEERVARFSSLYRVNARPVQPSNGRVIQSSIR